MEKKTFIIHHNADLDWVFGGAVLKIAHPDAKLVPMQYWDDIDLKQFEGHTVYMVDFSLPREQMKELNDNSNLIRLDHHISSIKEMEGLEIAWDRDTKRAGCLIAFEYLWNNHVEWCGEYKDIIQLISNYDIRKQDENREDITLPFQYWVRQEVWLSVDQAIFYLDTTSDAGIHDTIDAWDRILEAQRKMYKDRCSKAWEIEFDWHNCIALFGPKWGNSLVFDSVYDKEKHDMMVYIRYSIKDKNYTISLYSETIDCSLVAKKYGGWWHKWASWFMCKELPFTI